MQDAAAPPADERRVLEEEEQNTARLRILIQSLQSGILMEDRSRRILQVNQEFCRIFGIAAAPEDLVGFDCVLAAQQASALFPDPGPFLRRIDEILAAGVPVVGDHLVLQDGRILERDYMPVSLGVASYGHVWQYRDVTARKRAEQRAEEERVASVEQRKELERLRELDRFKTEFLTVAAHELNTPLTPIQLHLELLRAYHQEGLSAPQRQSLDSVQRSVTRLIGLVKDVLEATRLQAGRLSIEPVDFDLGTALREAVETFAEPARRAGVQLELRHAAERWARADARRVAQVLYNLLSNALKFTPGGGTIWIETGDTNDEVVIEVRDTGKGFRPEQVDQLFQAFSQLHDTSAQPGGTGLGLYICRGIIEAHHGRIWGHSPGPDQGASFSFSLPACPPRG